MRIRLLIITLIILGLAGAARAAVYVKGDSPGPSFDGSSWETAYHTIGQAVADAEVSMEAVWVARGRYAERISVSRAIEIYGGFAGTETDPAQRDRTANAAVVDAGGEGNAFTLSADARIDGFAIDNAEYGIFSESCSPTIAGNTITRCTAFGVYCFAGSPSIIGNSFDGNGFGIGCESSSALVSQNAFAGNSEYAVYSVSGSPVVRGNTMRSNYGGVYASSGGLTADANEILSNASCGIFVCERTSSAATNNVLAGNDDGMRIDFATAKLISNTIAHGGRYGVYWHDCSPSIVNNIIAFNDTGLYKFGGGGTLARNDVYGNGIDYADPIVATNDISADPLFADAAGGDYHLAPESPCINQGRNNVAGLPTFDLDGEGRIHDGKVDIGADEYWSPAFNPVAVKQAPEGAVIKMDGGIVSAAFADFLYTERADRASGIRVDKAAHGISERARVSIIGRVRTDDSGERYVAADAVTPDGSTGDIRPLALANTSLGGATAGLQGGVWGWQWNVYPGDVRVYEWTPSRHANNIGLLVTTWGRVTAVGDGYLYIDDGSRLDDGTLTGADRNIGVRVICDPADYAAGDYLTVTGISSCFRGPDGEIRRLIRVVDGPRGVIHHD